MKTFLLRAFVCTCLLSLMLGAITPVVAQEPILMEEPQEDQLDAEIEAYLKSLSTEDRIALAEKQKAIGFTFADNTRQKYHFQQYLNAMQDTPEGEALTTGDIAETPAPDNLRMGADRQAAPQPQGDGRNALDVWAGVTGDVLLGSQGHYVAQGWFSHVALVDRNNGWTNFTLHSPGWGIPVKYDQDVYFRNHYDQGYLMRVNSTKRLDAVNYARAQRGEPYNIFTTLWTENVWYCSKLVWAAYYRRANIDFRPFGWRQAVYPDEIYLSNYTWTVRWSW